MTPLIPIVQSNNDYILDDLRQSIVYQSHNLEFTDTVIKNNTIYVNAAYDRKHTIVLPIEHIRATVKAFLTMHSYSPHKYQFTRLHHPIHVIDQISFDIVKESFNVWTTAYNPCTLKWDTIQKYQTIRRSIY